MFVVPCARPRVDVDVPQLLARAAGRRDEVRGVLVAQDRQRLLRLPELDRAVGGEVPALRIAVRQVAACEERLRTIVVAGAEVDLG
jgi:hypothetical protein